MNFNRISFCDIVPGDLHFPPPLPRGFFPCEDFLFDEEKISLLSAIFPSTRIFPCEDFLCDEEKKSLLFLEVAMRISLRQRGNPKEENFLVGVGSGKECEDFLFDEEKISLLSAIPPPTRIFPCEDFLCDEEKNSLLFLEVAMRISLRQRGNPKEENFLVGVGSGKECEDFLFDKVNNLIETSIEYHFAIFSLVTSASPLSHEDFSLMRISSWMKRRTHGCPWKLP